MPSDELHNAPCCLEENRYAIVCTRNHKPVPERMQFRGAAPAQSVSQRDRLNVVPDVQLPSAGPEASLGGDPDYRASPSRKNEFR